ncbi:MAG: TonB-dependent receptor [Prevotella sp.]|nr:TonB-dependent receptor [Prevotella sp.]
MSRIILFCLLVLCSAVCHAQGSVRGKVLEKLSDETMPYVNVVVYKKNSTKPYKSAMTDEKGNFRINDISYGNYTVQLTFVGYKTVTREFSISQDKKSVSFKNFYLTSETQSLEEVTVTAQRPAMRLEVDRKSFDVSQDIVNAGGAASDVLDNIPSVEVDNDGNISLRGNTSVEVWINGKASGLTTDNRAEILQQLPAESIDRIEVIDNPSAKFSAEGSAGIINIVLKKDRKAGYYGSVQGGVRTNGGANASGNINFNKGRFEAYLNIGYRHRKDNGGAESYQEYLNTNEYQKYKTDNNNTGNNLFSRAGVTYHATDKDEFTLSGMAMIGGHNNGGNTPYHYGTIGADDDSYLMLRHTKSSSDMKMFYGEFNYRHNFTDKHFLDFTVDFNTWRSDEGNIYQDSTTYYDGITPTVYDYQSRPMYMHNCRWEVKLDYENPITENILIQAGYQGNFSRENTPQESYVDETSWEGNNQVEDETYYNRFIYNMDLHALYATATLKLGKFGAMAGLRGEYWKVHTESYSFEQEHNPALRDTPFDKDYFQLFPSVFLSYQITKTQQLQLNYTRRLRRPWGGQLNSFKNTRDASMISFGNPELTPEFSNSFSLNYLKQWEQHSLLLSAYYRPTTDVMQKVNYQSTSDGMMYSTNMNVAKSVSSGLEMVLKNQICKILNLTTTANAYYYKLDGFSKVIEGQTVTGEGNSSFTWNARMQASFMLPYDISIQLTGRYRSREVITQGYRKANISADIGLRKTFLNKTWTLAINCRDLLNTRKFENFTSSDTFTRHQKNWRSGRTVNFTLTYSFGNTKAKKTNKKNNSMGDDDQYSESGEEGI